MLIGSQNFSIELMLNRANATSFANADDSKLKAKWTALNNDYLEFEDIARAFGFSPPDIPKDLDLALEKCLFLPMISRWKHWCLKRIRQIMEKLFYCLKE